MLETLDSVDWADLTHAYGYATPVPDHIRGLRSANQDLRRQARKYLDDNLLHQGTCYEASPYAVPFLLELAADPATPDLAEVLRLLAGLTLGHNTYPDGYPVAGLRAAAAGGAGLLEASLNYVYEDDDYEDEDGDAENARFYRYCETLDRADSDRLYAHIALTAYEGVRAGLPLIRTLVTHAEAGVRTAATYLLAWFPEEAAASLPVLMPVAADPDADVAATALVAIGLLETPGTSEAVPALEAALDDPRDVVRWGAATALARLRGLDAGEKAVGELRGWADRISESRREIPYNLGDLCEYAKWSLSKLGDS